MEIGLILLPGNADVLLRESNDLCLFGNRVGAGVEWTWSGGPCGCPGGARRLRFMCWLY